MDTEDIGSAGHGVTSYSEFKQQAKEIDRGPDVAPDGSIDHGGEKSDNAPEGQNGYGNAGTVLMLILFVLVFAILIIALNTVI